MLSDEVCRSSGALSAFASRRNAFGKSDISFRSRTYLPSDRPETRNNRATSVGLGSGHFSGGVGERRATRSARELSVAQQALAMRFSNCDCVIGICIPAFAGQHKVNIASDERGERPRSDRPASGCDTRNADKPEA